MKERLTALSSRVTELEEDLDTARKDLIKSEEMNTKLQRDVREVRNQLSKFGQSQVELLYKICHWCSVNILNVFQSKDKA